MGEDLQIFGLTIDHKFAIPPQTLLCIRCIALCIFLSLLEFLFLFKENIIERVLFLLYPLIKANESKRGMTEDLR